MILAHSLSPIATLISQSAIQGLGCMDSHVSETTAVVDTGMSGQVVVLLG